MGGEAATLIAGTGPVGAAAVEATKYTLAIDALYSGTKNLSKDLPSLVKAIKSNDSQDITYYVINVVLDTTAVACGAKVLAPAVGKTIQQVTQGIKALNGSGVGNKGGSGTETTRVGRWMSQGEYDKMVETGVVQESYSGTTHVANPASIDAFGKQAKPGQIYVEFDVPTTSLKQTNKGWAKILGPNALEGRLAAKKGNPIPEMPTATNVEIVGGK